MSSPTTASGESSKDPNAPPVNPTEVPLADDIPELTFGLEIELNLAVRKWIYKAWIKNAIPGDAKNTNDYPADLGPATRQLRDEIMEGLRARDRERQALFNALPVPLPPYPMPSWSWWPFPSLALRSVPKPDEIPLPPSPTGSSTQTDSTQDTHSSEDFIERMKMLGYLKAYLSHTTQHSPRTPSLLGEIRLDPPKSSPDTTKWHLTNDDSILPHRDTHLVPQLLITSVEAHRYRVLGAELVSAVLNFDDMQSWYAQLQQLSTDLTFDDNMNQGAWFDSETHVHVHFGIKDDTISLEVAKNVCILYGIFETEIESWLPMSQRYSPWCKKLRLGMEHERLTYTDDKKDIQLLPGLRYTPSQFADMCYAAKNMQELKTKVTGWSVGEWVGSIQGYGIGVIGEPSMSVGNSATNTGATGGLRNWVSVNLSLARDNKPFTIEFRHHHGTMDPETIAWWVRFLGKLVRFAHYLARNNIQIKHAGRFTEDSFVDDLPNQSIFDLIGFPAEGILHFRRMRDSYLDPDHPDHEKAMDWQNARAREQELIDWRIMKRKEGEDTGKEMDDNYFREQTRLRTGVLPPPTQDAFMNHTLFGIVPGDEALRPVALTGQELVNRMVRIALTKLHGQSAFDARNVAGMLHKKRGGLNYKTEKGLNNLLAGVEGSGTGLVEIWKDALSAILAAKEANGEDLEEWEEGILKFYVPKWVAEAQLAGAVTQAAPATQAGTTLQVGATI